MDFFSCDFACLSSLLGSVGMATSVGVVILASIKLVKDRKLSFSRKGLYASPFLILFLFSAQTSGTLPAAVLLSAFFGLFYLLERVSLFFVADCEEDISSVSKFCLLISTTIAAYLGLAVAAFLVAWAIYSL
ncbi:hypothetical protein QWY31_01875 [Cytophagales bacterium LB-30]|uniref:DUF4956 domain-containing protein n=1 Tax=Shiella aurantiaca TaxID=3058365 RepID=A0ABT8F1A7_9BACT|nr:hypothetical protein [Shiella aurantiaca]MDN4164227.1 hypothetical protein [Shiella aurantiaca]